MVKHFLQFLKAIFSFVSHIHEPFIFITSVLPSPLQFLLYVPLPLARFTIFSYVIIILCLFNYWVHVGFHVYTYEAIPEWIVLNWTVSAGAPPWKKLFFSLSSSWPLVSLHVWAGPCGVFIVYNVLSAGTVIMLVLFRQPHVDILWVHSVILGDTV